MNFKKIFNVYRENAHLNIVIFGIRIRFKTLSINQLEETCCIANLEQLRENNVSFPHPVGIVISKYAKIGKNCTIYQNVTIGEGKFNPKINTNTPIIGDNTTIFANSVIFGGITIGKNCTIGAGSIILKDVEDNTVIAGNPPKIIKH